MEKFNIGDSVWCATPRGQRKSIICPDCFGTRTLRVILGDDTEMEIECSGCSSGYEPPSGTIQTWDYEPSVEHIRVTGVSSCLENGEEKIEYRCGHFVYSHPNIFQKKEDADIRANEMAKEQQEEQDAKILRKEKDTRSWAWCVHYHRERIRTAKRDIEYHSKKLDAANLRVRKPKKEVQ